jgi:isoquinoline 1-oxidoreductase subunit beta
MSTRLSRRSFLKAGAASGAVLVVGFHLDGEAWAQDPQEKKPPNPFDAWIRIGADGTVTLTLAKSEMGQGVFTALPMILADELDVDWSRVRIEQAATRPEIYNHGTGGSSSLRTSWLPLRQAAAAARTMLVGAAAERWNVNPNACRTERGYVMTGPRDKRLAYGELLAAAATRPVPDFKTVALRDSSAFRIVGTDIPRADVPPKVTGQAQFGLDVRVPGMLYAVVARCPTFGGKPARFDATAAKAVRGVRQVVEIPAVEAGAHTAGGIAVVADSTYAAMKGREALKVEWDHGPHAGESTASLFRQMAENVGKPGKVVRNDGDAPARLAAAARRVQATYELPFQAHATMEPMNATVHVRADGAEAWVPSQGPQWAKDVIAKTAGVPAEKVDVHTTFMGGGFGRRYHADFVVEAAQVSKAVGAPVQVVWTRSDDMQRGFYRPAALHRLEAALDESGRPVAWLNRMSSTSISSYWDPPDKAKPEESEIGGAVDVPYAIPNVRMEYTPAATGVPVMWWRSVESSMNAFAVESFLDELAAAAGADPLAYRLSLLAEPRKVAFPPDTEAPLDTARFKRVLEVAAEKAGWGKPLPKGRARGIAAHFSFHSYVAEVAEVSLEGGHARVHRVVAAVDIGRAIRPDSVRAQVEGAIAYGLTAALKGAITIADGKCVQANFDDFPMLRISEMPEVEVHIVPSTEAPTGIGEPGLPPIAPAVANALFALTGKRVRRLPVRAEDLA